MSTTITEKLHANLPSNPLIPAQKSNATTQPQKQQSKGFRMPTGYYFLLLFSPLLIGLSLVILGLLTVITGVLLILAAPFLLIVGLFVIPRDVSPEDPTWGWRFVIDRKAGDFREWVRKKVLAGKFE
ncbi:hypothetical protein ABW19_dt0202419 [Dactylella cylindrospora]|nr:hypothetical protein ABW19_dt0202419 [Dactylella cylindrospora]